MPDGEPGRLRRGYRRMRLRGGEEPEPLTGVKSGFALTDAFLGADQLARIEAEAAAMAPPPEPEDLLATWADGWYRSGDARWLYQIGLYVAEDLRLMGKVSGPKNP